MTGEPPARNVSLTRDADCWRGRFFAMASPCEVLCRANNASEAKHLVNLAADEVWRIEDKFSRYRPDNIIATINSAAGSPVNVDTETGQLLDFAATLYELSDHKFDITSGVLRRAWRFDGGSELPSTQRVSEILALVGWQKSSWRPPELRLEPDMEIDLGGIGKEYAVDRATALLRDASEVSCLVNLGGDLAVSRTSPNRGPWQVGIEALSAGEGVPANLLRLSVGALATSGDARRYVLKDGIRYSHILDARTGWPVENAPRSVTVAADTCSQAGMLSTLAMLEGPGAEEFLAAQGVDFWCDR